MAKNKNRDRSKQQSRASGAEQAEQQSRSSSMEAQAERMGTKVTPADVAHKGRQKRFGHN
ncbi:hypothetical protein [Streptomyces sp. URMC 123]|uniref:hypothetical protein n=1 Tax=Streptomyces sp. URMC 123 TaxID=3423403 RepID=UPI003F1CA3EC